MTIETLEKLSSLQEQAFQQNDFSLLEKFFSTEEYKQLPYLVRNRGFVSSHKLGEFMRCQFCYAQKYINEVPDPTENETKDAFVVGQAFDDLLTEGVDYFAQHYEVVSRRSKAAEKTQLTALQGEIIEAMQKEFKLNKCFNQNPKKKILFYRYKDIVLKVEMDDLCQIIRDIKTTASIKTFNPQYYWLQATMYCYVVEMVLGIKSPVMLEVVDKTVPSHSGAYLFSYEKLAGYREVLFEALDNLISAQETGIFIDSADQIALWGCPYYGYKGHGRLTTPILIN